MPHKNSNEAVGNFGIYEISVNGVVYKIGKADLDRITQFSGQPTRIHQQIRKLRKKYGHTSVFFRLLDRLLGVTTRQAKEVEYYLLSLYIETTGMIPEGNQKSFKPKKD